MQDLGSGEQDRQGFTKGRPAEVLSELLGIAGQMGYFLVRRREEIIKRGNPVGLFQIAYTVPRRKKRPDRT